MEINSEKYSLEITEFLNEETLEKIDYGILDLSKIEDYELKEALLFYEELLTLELKANYLENETGLFRVWTIQDRYCYNELGHIIEADSICELKEMVLSENRIWYVFDEISAEMLIGRQI